jgi:tRNA (cmo5U34)-methyltransferase
MSNSNPNIQNEWLTKERVLEYLTKANNIPHRAEGESVLLDHIPLNAKRVLDLGTGNGRLIKILNEERPNIEEAVAIDVSPFMLKAIRENFADDSSVKIIEHDLSNSLPYDESFGGRSFDVVVSSFAIHHLTHERKRSLYSEIFSILNPNGIFCNLDHVSSPTCRLHERFMEKLGKTPETEDRSNRLLDVESQLRWLQEIGFVDVDCYWKWLEFALLVGVKP